VLAPVTEVWNHRSIVRNLAQRELKAQYKKSVLG
jgi:ABC-type polysaccharide/polyol phosphate export permease